MLRVVNELTCECVSIRAARRLGSIDVIELLAEVQLDRGIPNQMRTDQGPTLIAQAAGNPIAAVKAKAALVETIKPSDNGFVGSFNGRMRDKLPRGEIFSSPAATQIMIERSRYHDNAVRPYSALGYRRPASIVAQRPVTPSSSQVATAHCTAGTEHGPNSPCNGTCVRRPARDG